MNKNKIPYNIRRKLKYAKVYCNIEHYTMLRTFCEAIFVTKNIQLISKWNVKIIERQYPEIINNKHLTKEIYEQIQEKLTFCKESL